MTKLAMTLALAFVCSTASANQADTATLAAAYDSAASYLINGKTDAKLVRAFEVLSENGMADSSNEEKAFAVLEANPSR